MEHSACGFMRGVHARTRQPDTTTTEERNSLSLTVCLKKYTHTSWIA